MAHDVFRISMNVCDYEQNLFFCFPLKAQCLLGYLKLTFLLTPLLYASILFYFYRLREGEQKRLHAEASERHAINELSEIKLQMAAGMLCEQTITKAVIIVTAQLIGQQVEKEYVVKEEMRLHAQELLHLQAEEIRNQAADSAEMIQTLSIENQKLIREIEDLLSASVIDLTVAADSLIDQTVAADSLIDQTVAADILFDSTVAADGLIEVSMRVIPK